MSYTNILLDIHQQNQAQNDEIDFDDEIQSLSNRLAEILARKHALEGRAGNPNDFMLKPDRRAYWQVYRASWAIFQELESLEF